MVKNEKIVKKAERLSIKKAVFCTTKKEVIKEKKYGMYENYNPKNDFILLTSIPL